LPVPLAADSSADWTSVAAEVDGAGPDGSEPAASESVASVWDEVADVVVAVDAADAVDVADLAVGLAVAASVPLPVFVAVPDGLVDPGPGFVVVALFVGAAVCWFDGGVAFAAGDGAVVAVGAAGAVAGGAAGVTVGAAGAAGAVTDWLSGAVSLVWLSRRLANSDD
jgi:hypothetical protein